MIRTQSSVTGQPQLKPSLFYHIGLFCAQHARFVLALWTVIIVGGAALTPHFLSSVSGMPIGVQGSESQAMQTLLKQHFTLGYAEEVPIVVYSPVMTVTDPLYQQKIDGVVAAVSNLPQVIGISNPLDQQGQDQISTDQHAAVVIVGVSGDAIARQKTANILENRIKSLADSQIQIDVSGESAVFNDMSVQEIQDIEVAERIGLPVALLVLLLAFGSLIAASLPILLGISGVLVTFGILSIASVYMSFDLFVETVVTLIGLGVGIDYSMFIVTRFRQELAKGKTVQNSIAISFGTSGKTIFFSAMTVLISLSGLFLVQMKLFEDLAIGAMVTVGVTISVALTLLPAVLALLGHRVNSLAVPGMRQTIDDPNQDTGFWARWARGIMRRPVAWLIGVVVIIAVLTVPIFQIQLGLNMEVGGLTSYQSGAGMVILQKYFSAGALSPLEIAVKTHHGALNDADLAGIADLTSALQANSNIAHVISVTSTLDQLAGNHSSQALAAVASSPEGKHALAYVVNMDQGKDITVLQVVTKPSPDSQVAYDLVKTIRTAIIPQTMSNTDTHVYVGGLSAQIVDMSKETSQKIFVVIGFILAMSYILLVLVFRSVFLPLKAIIMNGLSVSAAYGLLVFVFQQGKGERIFDFISPGFLQVWLPLFTFAFVFGLSMDYEVFLIGRMKEEWEKTGDNETAVARGLQYSAKAITSAAAIMVTIFGTFTLAMMLEMKQLGFSLAVAVLIDATLIRVLLVPAAMRIMGKWNWWMPSFLDRILPRIDIGEGM